MRKSEHTELASLTRLAVFASENGLHQLSYATAARTAHTSKGALQRLFPSKLALQRAILLHAATLLDAYVFAPAVSSQPLTGDCALRRWAAWIAGQAGLTGGCVLLHAAASRGGAPDVAAAARLVLEAFLRRLSTLSGVSAPKLLTAALGLDVMHHLMVLAPEQELEQGGCIFNLQTGVVGPQVT